ncbi:hypothetical protein JL720_16805 [Aureococcus anophagefferens]|nr:hypothetical protein JL720_16805 [Aureococcus anophagefferens]
MRATGPPLRFVGNAAVAEDDYEDDILSGGAIHLGLLREARELRGRALTGCSASAGGALFVTGDASVSLADAFAASASATYTGGFAHLSDGTIDGADDAAGSSAEGGAGIYVADGAYGRLRGVAFAGGEALQGAVLYCAVSATCDLRDARSRTRGCRRERAATTLYGPRLATGVTALGFVRSAYREASGVVFNASVEARVLDLYGSVVATSDGESVLLDVEGAELTGDSKGFTVAGRAVFRGVTLTRAPNASLTLRAEVVGAAPRLEAAAAVVLRACVAGEYVATNALSGTSTCLVCAAGSVSFAPSESCAACPKHATCAGGRRLVPDRGYWRSRRDSLNVVRCKENYCRSVDLLDEAPRDDVRAPSGACAGKHAPRCAARLSGTTTSTARR